jgi:glycosyltransferase involved in cell wall biosynthesis
MRNCAQEFILRSPPASSSSKTPAVRIAYLFSRYPVVSQTFVDTEMLALERAGVEIEIFSIYPPHTSFRHGHFSRLKAPVHYAPAQSILKLGEQEAKRSGRWPAELVASHERKYGAAYKAGVRARNALYFADLFKARGFTHFHVHFANRAAHTAVFLKAISGLPFSMSTHGQDYMVDLGNDELLAEICHEAVFVANETAWSTGEMRRICPMSAEKMFRVFNGMDLSNFKQATPGASNAIPRIVSIGRLIEFKGFHHLIEAASLLRARGLEFQCDIIGEGPWRPQFEKAIADANLASHVRLTGALPQEEVFAALKGCDIFALPCIVDKAGASDVFPTVILEAMASARPVVSTKIAGVPEQIVHGETGYICKPGDVTELADSLEKLLRSRELREQFGAAGQRRLQAEFSVDHTVKELKTRFEKCVRSSVPPPPRQADIAVLLQEWPSTERHEAELRQISETFPACRAYSFHPGCAPPDSWRITLPHCDFLPDSMVIEAEWQQQKDLRHRIETWRGDLGGKLSTEEYLRHARYALMLREWVKRDGVRHIHAASSREALTAWILRRLTGVTVSATIEEKTTIPPSILCEMAPEFSGFRIAGKRSDDPFAEAGKQRPFTVAQKSGRNFEPEWMDMLKRWALKP